ncbi:MAG: formylglycine-generating enzyme family protein [Planctomycetota bacterium]|nr:MAG: formylglycine-generating enzyme family protein [Planctomycetota bacterium]
MKISLPLKLGITVIVIFGLLAIGMVLWKPMKVRYYAAKLHSEDIKIRQHAARILLNLVTEGPKDRGTNRPVFNYYTDRYDPKDVKKRMKVVDELCDCGDKGKAVMKEIFRNWCRSPSQQSKIPPGTLTLENGSKVEIKSLYVDKFEVTMEKCCVYQSCTGLSSGFTEVLLDNIRLECYQVQVGKETFLYHEMLNPRSNITWHDAKAYADWLGMRLPTEYEWEYAARAGSTGKYCFGDNDSLLNEYAWYISNSSHKLHPVGQKAPNNWGVYDVHGNVYEYTHDSKIFADNGAPITPGCTIWIARLGGCCLSLEPQCSLSAKYGYLGTLYDIGFRCVRDP